MNRIRCRRNVVLASCALFAGLASASSADAQTQPAEDRWEFTLAPYVMGASLDGTSAVMGREAQVDVSASDIFDHLEIGFMGMAVARKGDWGVVADAVFVELSVPSDMPPADFKPTIGIFAVQGVRRLTDYADVTVGARWNHLKAVIDLKAPVALHVEKSRNWVDPVVGVVLRTPGNRRFHGRLIADVGGFGVGSNVTWQLFPTVGVQVSKRTSIEAGWRFLKTDYETGEGAQRFAYDMLYQGPVLGFTFRF
jgi:hypothetical protein